MKSHLLIFLLIGIVTYVAIAYYIGRRGWQAFGAHLPRAAGIGYVILYVLLSLSFFINHTVERSLSGPFSTIMSFISAYWMGGLAYFLLLLLAIDLLRWADRRRQFLPASWKSNPPAVGLCIIALVCGLMVYGSVNARHPRLVRYDVAIEKPAGNIKELHIVLVSDIHLGRIVNRARLAELIDRINGLQPDLVVFPGDTVNEDATFFLQEGMADEFRRLRSRYGAFAVMGNHDYLGGKGEEIIRALAHAGVTMLRDEHRLIAGSFYLAGRDDKTGRRFSGHERKALAEVLDGIDRQRAVILLDHQPFQLEEGQQQGVDLQLSGHTHRGQFFPNNLITNAIYDEDWGYLRNGAYQIIVSCGYGTWGPPIRIGNRPELVDIHITFTDPVAKANQ